MYLKFFFFGEDSTAFLLPAAMMFTGELIRLKGSPVIYIYIFVCFFIYMKTYTQSTKLTIVEYIRAIIISDGNNYI